MEFMEEDVELPKEEVKVQGPKKRILQFPEGFLDDDTDEELPTTKPTRSL